MNERKRERGEGSVFKRGDRWWIKYNIRGRSYSESSGSTYKANAIKLLRTRLAEIAAGRTGPVADKVTFLDLMALVENDYVINGRKSTDRMRRAVKHLREAFQYHYAIDITGQRVLQYARQRMDAGAAPATVMWELAVLRRGFKLARLSGQLSLQHIPHFPTLEVNNTRTGFFDDADFEKVVAELPDHVKPIVRFMNLTGWRSAEVKGLEWRHVDLEAGTVRLDPGTTKNGDGRVFPVKALPALEQLLRQQRAVVPQDCPWVFPYHGKRIGSFRTAWRSAVRRAGVARSPHDFRRTAIRRLERAGVARSVAMALVGHKTESIYRRYAIVSERDLAEGVAKVAALTPQPQEG